MSFLPLIQIVSFIVISFMWSAVFAIRSRDELSRSYLVFTGCGVLWVFLEVVVMIPSLSGYERFFLRLLIPFWASIGVLFLHFVYRLLEKTLDAVFFTFAFLTVVAVLFDIVTGKVVIGFHNASWGVSVVFDNFWHGVVCLPTLASGAFGLALLGWNIKGETNDGLKKKYMLIALAGLPTLLGISILNVFIPLIFGPHFVPRYGSSAMALFCFFVYMAGIKYRFLSFSVVHVAEEMFKESIVGVVFLGPKGVVRRMNRAAMDMIGIATYTSGTPIDALSSDFVLSMGLQKKDIVVKRDEGERFYFLSRYKVAGEHFGEESILVIVDETEQKMAQDVLRKSRDSLEKEVRLRTKELYRTQKMDAIGALAGGIARDFNNLLAVIMGYSSAAKYDLPAGHLIQEDIDEVILATRRAKEITRQLLSFSTRGEKSFSEIDVLKIVEEVLAMISVSRDKSITVKRDYKGKGFIVKGNATRIYQVFMNLCTNALFAMQKQGGVLTVTVESISVDDSTDKKSVSLAPGNFIKATVQDTGVGINKNVRDKIFEPFFTTKKSTQGTGLGLAMVFQILNEHNGKIDVQSVEGEGSIFTVYLPSVDTDIVAEPNKVLSYRKGHERILLVDDKEQVVKVCKRMLEPLGYVVITFTDAYQALAAFLKNPNDFDLLISDFSMPGLSGIQLGHRIFEVRPELPMILLSGRFTPEEQGDAKQVGYDKVIFKPISKGQLSEAIAELLSASREMQ